MNDQSDGLTIEELAASVGVSVRTVRFYIAEGLIPGPGQRGKGTLYGAEHLLKLRLARRLSEQHVPLTEIRDRLARLPLAEARSLLDEEARREAELQRAEQSSSPKEYLSALLQRASAARHGSPEPPPAPLLREAPAAHWLAEASPRAAPGPGPSGQAPAGQSWRRLELAPGLELHVREDVAEAGRQLVERLLQAARES